ncbi:MAG TPA: hypothetical protein VF531_10245 [Bacillota bacterium]
MRRYLYVPIFIILTVAMLFLARLEGYVAAAILGTDAIVLDLYWQWLRFILVRLGKTSHMLWGILGGFVLRIACLLAFIKLSSLFFKAFSSYFYVFAILLLTIPLWSLIVAYKFKQESNRHGDLS